MELTEFLLARIAEDEAESGGESHWQSRYQDPPAVGLESTHDGLIIDPARAMAECEAKRQLLGLHWFQEFTHRLQTDENGVQSEIEVGSFEDIVGPRGTCHTCSEIEFPCRTLRAIALPYADHPDYREEWRP